MKAKKAYIIPTTTTCKINAANMLAASGKRGISEESAQSYTDKGGIAGDDNGDVYSRESLNAWDEW